MSETAPEPGANEAGPPARVPPKPRRTARLKSVDRQFLPAALEILETPASPVGMALILIICALFAVALAWSYFGKVDIVAVAQGKIQPTGRVKTVQALETSRVLSVSVQNGSHVQKGDVLVRLDPRDAKADEAAASAELSALRAESIRRNAAMAVASLGKTAPLPTVAWPASIPDAIKGNELQVLQSDLAQLAAQTASLEAQAEQKRAERLRLKAMTGNERDLVGTLQQRVEMRQELIRQGAGSKSNLLDSLEALQRGKTDLARDNGQLAEIDANLQVIERDIKKAFDTFVADNAQKYSEAQRRVGELQEKLVRAEVRSELTTLRSPSSGVIQASSVTTVGQVVTPSEELMRIVPDGATLEVECYLPNRDIGFVHERQSAVIKVEAFPFTRFGSIKAEVVRVAHDAIPEPEAQQTEQDAGRLDRNERGGRAQRVQNLVFPVTLRLDSTTMQVEGVKVPLQAGMAVIAEIRTGDRRIIDYVLSPLIQVGSEALKER